MRAIGLILFASLAIVGGAACAVAAAEETEAAEGPLEDVALSYLDCVGYALDANPDILVAEYGPLIEQTGLQGAWAVFEPRVDLRASWESTRTDTDSRRTDTDSTRADMDAHTARGDISLGGLLPWGMNYSLGLNVGNDDAATQTHSAGTTLAGGGNSAVSYQANDIEDDGKDWGATAGVSQPLLRGRGLRVNLAGVRMAKNGLAASKEEIRSRVMNQIASVINAYWVYVGAIADLKVQETALENAKRLLRDNQSRYRIGTIAYPEVQQSQAGVAFRESILVGTLSNVADAEDALKRMMGLRPDDAMAHKRIVPTDTPTLRDVPVDETASIARALENRPEIHIGRLLVDNSMLEKTQKANDLLPQLDLTASVESGGRNSTSRTSSVLDQGFQRSVERDKSDTVTYAVGIEGSIPIGNRAARSAYERTKLETKRAEQLEANTEQQIMWEVRRALRDVQTSRNLVQKSEESTAMARASLEAEGKRMSLGVSTSFQVLRMQEDLTRAELQEVQARIGFESSMVDLQLAEGILLETLGISISEPLNR